MLDGGNYELKLNIVVTHLQKGFIVVPMKFKINLPDDVQKIPRIISVEAVTDESFPAQDGEKEFPQLNFEENMKKVIIFHPHSDLLFPQLDFQSLQNEEGDYFFTPIIF